MRSQLHRRDVVVIAAFLAFCLASFLLLFTAGGGRIVASDGYRVQAVLPTAVALVPNSDVRMGGVRVGRVTDVGSRNGKAIVLLDIDREHAPVHRDARVAVRLKSLVGENYIEIDRGTRETPVLPDGGVLPLRNADPSTQLDEIVSTFDPATRTALRGTLDGMGDGLRGRGGDLNRLLAGLAGAIDSSAPVARVLAGQREEVGDLVLRLGRVMRGVGERRDAVALLARQTLATTRTVARRDERLAEAISELPGTLKQIRSATSSLGALSVRAAPVVGDLRVAVERRVPAADRLGSATRATKAVTGELRAFAAPGTRLLRSLGRFSADAKPQIPNVDATLAQYIPSMTYLSRYADDAAAFFANLRSMSSTTDATGNVARVQGVFGPGYLPLLDDKAKGAADALVEAGALSPLLAGAHDYYPKPGTISNFTQYTGQFPRLQALPALASDDRRTR